MTTRPAAPSAQLLLALLADARLPSGGHTVSAGLEPALRHGLSPEAVPAYMAARLRTVTAVEAGTAVVARSLSIADGGGHAGLDGLEIAWAARTPSPALRASAQRLGRAYARLLQRLWPHPVDEAGWRPTRGVALGVLAARAGLPAADLVRLVGYDDLQCVAAAMLKLEPIDPLTSTGWVLALAPEVDTLAERLAHLTHPDDIPACSAPQIEEWAEIHDRTRERLFSA